jgi:prevent-host-death family protein
MCYSWSVERIGVRELRQHASRYIAKVRAGESVEVTDRGHLVALLVPPAPGVSAREELIAGGQLVPASGPFRLPRRTSVTTESSAVLEAIRAER